jgi:ribosomal protein S18 acetylase RimI-like enzyme
MTPGDDVRIEPADPASVDARSALRRYLAEVAARIPGGKTGPDEAGAVGDYRPPDGVFLLVSVGDTVVGCGAVRRLEPGVGEVKRMWIDPDTRGRGLGRRLLDALEDAAHARGYDRLRLDTHEVLVQAIGLYETQGYRRIGRYNDHPDPTHFYEKVLGDAREPAQPPPERAR